MKWYPELKGSRLRRSNENNDCHERSLSWKLIIMTSAFHTGLSEFLHKYIFPLNVPLLCSQINLTWDEPVFRHATFHACSCTTNLAAHQSYPRSYTFCCKSSFVFPQRRIPLRKRAQQNYYTQNLPWAKQTYYAMD